MAYINGMGAISPQQSWGQSGLLTSPKGYIGNRLSCIEPDYSQHIDAKSMRRMSRIIRMGVAAASMALRESRIALPGAIITGTSYGCQEDTGSFLAKISELSEQALNPTPFIQSTHNTIGSQIALLLQCQGYNQTYAHGALSFENALLDAMLQLEEQYLPVLVGAVDEIIDLSHDVLDRLGVLKRKSGNSLDLFEGASAGTVNGEGAAYFVLAPRPSERSMARLVGVASYYRPSADRAEVVQQFLAQHEIQPDEVDLVLLGKNGIAEIDQELSSISAELFGKSALGVFKHLCGEFPVASSFAVWLSASIIRHQSVPEVVLHSYKVRKPETILVVNKYLDDHLSLILLRAC